MTPLCPQLDPINARACLAAREKKADGRSHLARIMARGGRGTKSFVQSTVVPWYWPKLRLADLSFSCGSILFNKSFTVAVLAMALRYCFKCGLWFCGTSISICSTCGQYRSTSYRTQYRKCPALIMNRR